MAAIWAILGAIINPSKFLPWATASIALFAVLLAKLIYYRLKYTGLVKKVIKIVEVRMN